MILNSTKRYFKLTTLTIITLLFGLLLVGCDNSSINKVNINVISSNPNYGSVSGSGSYKEGSTVTLKANAKKNHIFVGWYDNDISLSTDVVYKFTATEDLRLVGKFERYIEGKDIFIDFIKKVNNTFKEAVGIDAELIDRYDDGDHRLVAKAHYEDGKVISAYLNSNDQTKMWINKGVQYNYQMSGEQEKEVTKHTYIEDKENLSTQYIHSYIIQKINSIILNEDIEYRFIFDKDSKQYILEFSGNQDATIKFKLDNNRLVESVYEYYEDNIVTMTLVEKIVYDIKARPVIPVLEEHDYLEIYWLIYQAPTGESTRYFEPLSKIPMLFGDDYFDENNIEGYYYDEFYSNKVNFDDILTRDTTIYYKLKDGDKIDFIIKFTNPTLETISLENVYIGQIVQAKFFVPRDTLFEEYYNSIITQLINLGIEIRSMSSVGQTAFTIGLVMPNESRTIIIK